MFGVNNALNVPLNDGQLIVGQTGTNPVAANITGTGAVTVTNGPGAVNIDASFSGFNFIRVPNIPDPVILQRDTIYYTDWTAHKVFFLPNPATAGSMFYIMANNNLGTNERITIIRQDGTLQKLWYDANAVDGLTSFQTPGGPRSILIICIDDSIPGGEFFQVCGAPIGIFEPA